MHLSALRVPTQLREHQGEHVDRTSRLLFIAQIARICFISVALLFMAVIIGLSLYSYTHANRMYEGVTVGGVSVGGLTTTEARIAIEQRFRSYANTPILLIGNDRNFSISPRDAGMSLDSMQSAEIAFAYGRSGSVWARSHAWVRAALWGSDLPVVAKFDDDRLDAQLARIGDEIVRPPRNASVSMTAVDRPAIVPEVPGIAFDRSTTHARLISRFSQLGTEPVSLALPSIQPTIAIADLESSLDGAREAVGQSFIIATKQKGWILQPNQLKQIVSVPSEDRTVAVNDASLKGLVEQIATEIDQPSIDARLVVTTKGNLKIIPAVDMVQVDIDASVAAAIAALRSGAHDSVLIVRNEPAAITDDMANAALAQAEQLVAQGIELEWNGGSAKLGRGDLISAITITNHPGADQPIALGFDETVLSSLLDPIREKIDIPGQDAQFRLEDGKVKLIAKEETGHVVDIEKAAPAINKAIIDHESSVQLPIKTVIPQFTAADKSSIHVKDILGEGSTNYSNSSEPRRRNVEIAVRLETGWLVPPGGIFSYVQHIGGVTAEQGFVTGFGIVADGAGGVTTAPVIGGGICQVSTTIFQAAYWAGLEVVERYTHPYWIQSYGEPPHGMKGLDAMVNVEDYGSLDLKLRNTTGNWIAITVRADGENVIANVLGTDPGWTVELQQPTITNIVSPPGDMLYTESPELPAGQEMLVESAQDGFDAAIYRTIKKGDEVIAEDVVSGTYAPSRDTTLRGTGE